MSWGLFFKKRLLDLLIPIKRYDQNTVAESFFTMDFSRLDSRIFIIYIDRNQYFTQSFFSADAPAQARQF